MTRLLVFLLLFCFVYVRAHSHSNEPPHLKYTREVNEAVQEAIYNDKDARHLHGHSHEGVGCAQHGHSHHADDNIHSHSHGHSHNGHSHSEKTAPEISKPTFNGKRKEYSFDQNGMFAFLNDARTRLWVYSIGSTLLISAFPCLILAFIPIQGDTDENSSLLKLLLAFGAGGLLGDAFLHLIPHATPPSEGGHAHSHSHAGSVEGHSHEPHDMSVGQWVLIGFMAFFIVEKFVRIMRGDDSLHSHSHSHVSSQQQKIHAKPIKAKHSDASADDTADSETSQTAKIKAFNKVTDTKTVSSAEVENKPRIRVAAYLNLVADFMHNFTDGLAIGASFIAGSTVGVVTMITVLVHEVPHEIGDFAILVRSGYSKQKAMLIQLCTACGALAGCIISLWSVDAYAMAEAAGQSWVLPFTAGGFIYIATVSVIPELLERSTFWQSVRETGAIILGVFLMYLIAFYE